MLAALANARTALQRTPAQTSDITEAKTALAQLSALLQAHSWTDVADQAGKLRAQPPHPLAGADPGAVARLLPPEVRAAMAAALARVGLPEGDAPAGLAPADRVVELVKARFAGLGDRDPKQVVVAVAVIPVIVVDGARTAVDRVAQEAEELAADPAADGAWVNRAKRVLRRAQEVVIDILVAAAFCLPLVQEAAQKAAGQAGELLWLVPSLLAVGIMGALGVKLARDLDDIQTTG